jgi:hypothetical protein
MMARAIASLTLASHHALSTPSGMSPMVCANKHMGPFPSAERAHLPRSVRGRECAVDIDHQGPWQVFPCLVE